MQTLIILTISSVIVWLSYKYIRPRFYQAYWALLYLLAVIGLIGWLCSCSATYHKKQFFKKGGTFECKTDSVLVPQIIKGVNGEDSTVTKYVKLDCPDIETPQTKFDARQERKRIKDSLDHDFRMQKQADNFELKRLNLENKRFKLENDSLKLALKASVKINDSDNEAKTKQVKSENKKEAKKTKTENKKWNLFWIGVIVGCAGTIVLILVVLMFWKSYKYYVNPSQLFKDK